VGPALVADFGLARGPLGPSDLSHTGSVMGTPHYMAPEQAENPKGVDTRADIYSFGATFYHLLTGRPAFDGETAFTVMFKHKTEPLPSPRARNPALSARTSELLERCMAKCVNDRFASFAEILKHLQPEVATVSPWDSTEDRELDPYLEKYRARRDHYLAGRRNLTPEGDRYEFPSGAVLIIRSGNIVHEEVDAIVSSDDDYLTMGGGFHGVSGAIYQAAGPSIREETKRYVPVRQGRAVVTSAGRMKARFVFHGVTLGARQYTPSRDIICEILASCLDHADTLFVKSMALPLLGTGVGGFSSAVCLDTMFRYFALALHRGVTSVREVRIILFA
jgi:O-acetyl-ADP-ribose deacetylase (regulator of RNase III)